MPPDDLCKNARCATRAASDIIFPWICVPDKLRQKTACYSYYLLDYLLVGLNLPWL